MPTYAFGVDASGVSTYGQPQSFEKSDEAEIAEIKDANGDIHENTPYGDNNESMSFEVIRDTAAAALNATSELTIGGEVFYLTKVTLSEENESYKKYKVEGTRKVTAGTPA